MSLQQCRTQQPVRVREVDLDDPLRAAELGLRPGTVVRVTQRGAFGGVVLAVGGARVAVDARTARHITVEPVEV